MSTPSGWWYGPATWFETLGGRVEGLMVVARGDAEDEGAAAVMRRARFIYLAGSSPMHIRSVLKHSAVWDALVAAWHEGAVVAGSSGAAMALTDPMVDARGGGLTIGLGLVSGVAVVPHFGDAREDGTARSSTARCSWPRRAPRWWGSPSAPPSSATPAGWRAAGADAVAVYLDGAVAEAGLAALPA